MHRKWKPKSTSLSLKQHEKDTSKLLRINSNVVSSSQEELLLSLDKVKLQYHEKEIMLTNKLEESNKKQLEMKNELAMSRERIRNI